MRNGLGYQLGILLRISLLPLYRFLSLYLLLYFSYTFKSNTLVLPDKT